MTSLALADPLVRGVPYAAGDGTPRVSRGSLALDETFATGAKSSQWTVSPASVVASTGYATQDFGSAAGSYLSKTLSAASARIAVAVDCDGFAGDVAPVPVCQVYCGSDLAAEVATFTFSGLRYYRIRLLAAYGGTGSTPFHFGASTDYFQFPASGKLSFEFEFNAGKGAIYCHVGSSASVVGGFGDVFFGSIYGGTTPATITEVRVGECEDGLATGTLKIYHALVDTSVTGPPLTHPTRRYPIVPVMGQSNASQFAEAYDPSVDNPERFYFVTADNVWGVNGENYGSGINSNKTDFLSTTVGLAYLRNLRFPPGEVPVYLDCAYGSTGFLKPNGEWAPWTTEPPSGPGVSRWQTLKALGRLLLALPNAYVHSGVWFQGESDVPYASDLYQAALASFHADFMEVAGVYVPFLACELAPEWDGSTWGEDGKTRIKDALLNLEATLPRFGFVSTSLPSALPSRDDVPIHLSAAGIRGLGIRVADRRNRLAGFDRFEPGIIDEATFAPAAVSAEDTTVGPPAGPIGVLKRLGRLLGLVGSKVERDRGTGEVSVYDDAGTTVLSRYAGTTTGSTDTITRSV